MRIGENTGALEQQFKHIGRIQLWHVDAKKDQKDEFPQKDRHTQSIKRYSVFPPAMNRESQTLFIGILTFAVGGAIFLDSVLYLMREAVISSLPLNPFSLGIATGFISFYLMGLGLRFIVKSARF